MVRFAESLRRVPLLAWVTVAILLAWIVTGSVMWARSSGNAAEAAPSATPTPSASPSPSVTTALACTASAEVSNAWEGGFQIDVTVTAVGEAIEDWAVTLDIGAAQVDGAWNSTLAKGDTGLVTASNSSYNGALAGGASATFGFTASGDAPGATSATCASTTTPSASGSSTTNQDGAPPSTYTSASHVNSPLDDDWLSTDGNRIVDANGDPVWLTGANWFGFNTSDRVLHGLWGASLDDILNAIASRGINVLRIPISTELLLEWKAGNAAVPSGINEAVNPDLVGKTSLEVFETFLAGSKDRGLKVILDVHSAKADNSGHIAPLWSSGDITEADFYDAWAWVAERYRHEDTIIAFDLENEPHGQPSDSSRAMWDGSTSSQNWRHVAEEAAKRIQEVHPDVLILVEGVEATPKAGKTNASTSASDYNFNWWGGNLRAVDAFPVRLDVADKLVYSPHEYGPLVFEQPWFAGAFSAASLRSDVWEPNWLYLHDDGTAPLLIGEWGGSLGEDARQDKWMTALRDLIVSEHLAHTFWCINPNSSDTGGLLLDDWTSWDEAKYALLRPALWQDRDGKFVSLDHVTPLPGGISVATYYKNGNAAPEG